MHAYVRSFRRGAWLALLIAGPAAATDGIFLPQAPRGSGGEDTVQSSTGSRCSQSMNSNGAYVDLGLVGRVGSELPERFSGFASDARDQTATAYARVTIPLGKQPERLNCNQLYQLEIERLQAELELLKMNAE